MLVSFLLIGSACAAGVNDFKVDSNYKNVYSGKYYSVYTQDNNSGILIFKNVDDDVYEHVDNDDIMEGIIHHDGREYITPDDDMTIEKNQDNTTNFKDLDHATQGISEVINVNGEQYIVVVWAKNSANIDMAKLSSILNDFNKNNNVSPIAH